ncbi:hypothetical protein [Enterobacter bugandensis]|uniref:hypothetical protein n=1 Tax=Enterobacter bugandensis TaxID=881260 RepID=UPI00235FFF85|nr:hypothetical protein [Enterobacter bugandensis]
MNVKTSLAISLIFVTVSSEASINNCGSLASDYNGAYFNDEVAVESNGTYPVRYQFQSTSQYSGNVKVFLSGSSSPSETVSGQYSVIPSRVTNLGVTHGQVGVFLDVKAQSPTYFCGDINTDCSLSFSLTPTCSALGLVKQLSGDRVKLTGGADNPTARSLNAQNWTR